MAGREDTARLDSFFHDTADARGIAAEEATSRFVNEIKSRTLAAWGVQEGAESLAMTTKLDSSEAEGITYIFEGAEFTKLQETAQMVAALTNKTLNQISTGGDRSSHISTLSGRIATNLDEMHPNTPQQIRKEMANRAHVTINTYLQENKQTRLFIRTTELETTPS